MEWSVEKYSRISRQDLVDSIGDIINLEKQAENAIKK